MFNQKLMMGIEQFNLKANTLEDWLDIKARDFWTRNQKAFFDVRVLMQCESAKKLEYMQGILNVEQDSFTPPGFCTNGGMGRRPYFAFEDLGRLSDLIWKKFQRTFV